MKKTIIASILGIAITGFAGTSFAQLGGMMNAFGGKQGSASNSVTAESLVKSYVIGTKQVMGAEANFSNALGLKDNAAKAELAAKNLTEGATSSGLEDAAKVQTETSAALTEAMNGKKVVLSAESKKLYALGIVELTKGIRSYMNMSSDVQNFKPSITSVGTAASSAMYVTKTLPDSITKMKDTLGHAISFAKENNIKVDGDATNLLGA